MNLKAETLEDYLIQFNEFLDSEQAKNKKGIIYIWKTEKSISRVIGKSPIIYIGQSINTFRDRYKNSKSIKIEEAYYKRYYKYMIKEYGAISIEINESTNPKYQEWQALMEYNAAHKEYPPLNRSIPNEPKNP